MVHLYRHTYTRRDDSPSGSYCGAIIVFTCPFLASAADYVTAEKRGKERRRKERERNEMLVEGLNSLQCFILYKLEFFYTNT